MVFSRTVLNYIVTHFKVNDTFRQKMGTSALPVSVKGPESHRPGQAFNPSQLAVMLLPNRSSASSPFLMFKASPYTLMH